MSSYLIIRVHVVMLFWLAVVIFRAVEVHGRWGWRYVWPILAAESIFFLIYGTGLTYVCD